MRTLRLAHIAAEAEGIRFRHRARRAVVRLALAVVALGFLMGAVVLCHVAAWCWLRQSWEPQEIALVLAGVDAVLALLLLLVAAWSTASRVELEALAVRQQAVNSITGTLAVSALAAQLLRVVVEFFRRGRG